MTVKFDLDNLEQYIGAKVTLRNGDVATIENIRVTEGGGFVKRLWPVSLTTSCTTWESYTLDGLTSDPDSQHEWDIVSLEMSKKPEYEVFKIEKYADLDTLLERWNNREFERVSHSLSDINVTKVNGNIFVCGTVRVTIGYALRLYPKKKTKLERIVESLKKFDYETPALIKEIEEILNESEDE